ncbi:MAG: MFS transporter [Bacteroidetes bacterium]|nr:MAG: MFS transporter [Bacteroidota bacterium]
MGIKLRLTIMNFLQFFIWGAWLITIGGYWFQTKQWSGAEFGAIFSTMGIASLFMPALAGIIADRWINAEKLLGSFHIMGAIILFTVPMVESPTTMFWVMLINMIFYMPTISLTITVAYSALKKQNLDVVKEYPPIRVFGTIGFIVAMWTVSLLKIETSAAQFYIASAASLILGFYSFTLPKCEVNKNVEKKNFVESLGLKAFTLFKQKRMALFFIFSMLLGAALQLTNMYGDTFIHDFAKLPEFKDLLAVKYPAIIMSISQMSETLFILAIPFFLKRFGIKKVMLMSMLAWVLRFGLFGLGDPAGGLWMIILSCIVYGMAFDFFNISGSLYVEMESDSSIRASAQGLFMMMTNGFGAIIGSALSGLMIDMFFKAETGEYLWDGIWFSFAAYALVVAVLFAIFFKYKHNPDKLVEVHH